jgi:hypothetical protein
VSYQITEKHKWSVSLSSISFHTHDLQIRGYPREPLLQPQTGPKWYAWGGGGLSSAPPSTCLVSRYNSLPWAMCAGWHPFTVLSVSLSPSPPFSVSRQTGRGLKFALSMQNNPLRKRVSSIPASSDTVESKGRQMKQCWLQYIERKKNPPVQIRTRFLILLGAADRFRNNESGTRFFSSTLRYLNWLSSVQAHPHFMGGPPPGFPPGAPPHPMQLGPPGGMMVPPAAHSYGQQRPPQDFGRPPRQSPLEEGKSVYNVTDTKHCVNA